MSPIQRLELVVTGYRRSMSEIAARGAVEIDRLVLGINHQVGPRYGAELMSTARALGLESLALVPHLGEFWLHGPVPLALAQARMPYAAPGSVAERVDRLESLGLLTVVQSGHTATETFRPLLTASIDAREQVVAGTWSGFEGLVEQAEPLVTKIVESVSAEHLVAAAHRELVPPMLPLHRFYWRLVTLRYIRQHDHVTAWRSVGLDAGAASVLTALWLGEAPALDAPGWVLLERDGLVSDSALTDRGREVRDAIEADTNHRAGIAWSVLGTSEAEHLVALLEALPSSQG